LSAAALIVVAGFAGYRFSYLPLVCNRIKATVLNRTKMAIAASTQFRAAFIARDNLKRLERCDLPTEVDVDVAMLAAANYRVLDRQEDAVRQYQRALAVEKRPEIYLNLGQSLERAGRRAEAVRAYAESATFAPLLVDEIEDPAIRDEIRKAVAKRDEALRSRSVSTR